MSLVTSNYRTLSEIKGPLVVIERIGDVTYGEIVAIRDPDGGFRRGRVLEIDQKRAIVQVFEGTSGLDLDDTEVTFVGEMAQVGVSLSMVGRAFDGAGYPIDGKPPIISEALHNINGKPINPIRRQLPNEFIQTGISAIDGLNTLARGQKLPIFGGAGLPTKELAAQIAHQARVISQDDVEPFVVVFGAIGITQNDADFFTRFFEESGAIARTVFFLNRASDPTMERFLTPRFALTTAEYLAFTHHRHVLVILTDLTNYCEALREIASAREEIPGRRGYPGYMYSDLASLYERAGRVQGSSGSITQLILLSMPDDDITHPIPDLTGYITEGQIVLSRDLFRRGINPPIDVLPSLSRLMNNAIGEGITRRDHRSVADQLYALYAEGQNLRKLVAIVGEGTLSSDDQMILDFTDQFEEQYIGQDDTNRAIADTLDLAWELMRSIPVRLLKRVSDDLLTQYREGTHEKDSSNAN